MALVERLCQLSLEDDPINGEPGERHIALNDFVEGLHDILGGYHTTIQMKTFYDMTAEDIVEFDVLVAQIGSVSQLQKKMGRVHRVRSILTKWEKKDDLNVPGYDTVGDIRVQLNNIDNGFN